MLGADYSDVTVESTVLTGNGKGLACVTQAAGSCKITASSNLVNQNTTGIISGRGVAAASGAAIVYLTDNKIVSNATGLALTTAAHGSLVSLGDNTVVGNVVKGAATGTAAKL